MEINETTGAQGRLISDNVKVSRAFGHPLE